MRKDKNIAVDLRQQGKSYREISSALGVSKSTLSEWFSNNRSLKKTNLCLRQKSDNDSRERMRKLNLKRADRLSQLYRTIQKVALQEFDQYQYNPLFIAGLSLYWGEGDKVTKYNVRIANTDPRVIRIFVDFLITICQIEYSRIKSWLLLYPDLSEGHSKEYWIREGGLRRDGFTKTIFTQGRHRKNKVKYGTCYVGISNRQLKIKILVWLQLLSKWLCK
jgi:transcriptional regulator with XRE-family HTH domain